MEQMTPPTPAGEAMGGPQRANATPEQQEAYNRFVGQALLHVFGDEKVMTKILDQIGDDPVQDVGRTAANIGFVVLKKAEAAGETVPPEVILHGGQEIVGVLAEMAKAGKRIEMTPDDIEKAYYVAADIFRQMMQGEGGIDPETAAGDIEALRQMEESGELEALMQAASQDQAQGAA
jgi:hypothetical protein